MAEILPVPYSHVVFTPPGELDELALRYPREFYAAMMRAAGQAVVDVGRSELHLQLGCEVHLHTWGEDMPLHPHAHCMVPCGGFAEDGQWLSFRPQDLSAEALSRRFRVLLCRAMRRAVRKGNLDRVPQAEQILVAAESRPWCVYSQPPFGGPEQLLRYLAKYMYRVAITNDRIVSYENHKVTFRRRDCGRSTTKRLCILDAQEFLRRFVLHVLPKGFVRVRSYGFMANHNRKRNNERARECIGNAKMRSQREPFSVLCLCPACYDAWSKERSPSFAVRLDLAPQNILTSRPPPTETVAA
jgi:Putative transposase